MACTIHPDEIKRLSALDILNVKGTDLFNIHVLTANGELTAAQVHVLAQAAEMYGSGALTFSAQTTVTVRGIHYNNIDAVLTLLSQVGLVTGGTGSRVHPIIACRGASCRFGLCNTLTLYEKMHKRFYLGYHGVDLPHKFKIACGGCPNNCAKPNLNDVGIMGQLVPTFDPTSCKKCVNCSVQSSCPMCAAKIVDGVLCIAPEICNHCGRCVSKCPFGAVTCKASGIAIYIGGRSGKKTTLGQPLDKFFTSEDEVLDIVEGAILLYQEQGLPGERFADTIERLGFKNVQHRLLSGEVLARKASILSK